ncbi:hypothetical protein [Pseudomonas psychrophila]|uniref:Uncharacterized protein n=1 Tax=Pseudomonas psychrophila TaxID=122355 RepID=A0A8I1FZC7_9PSED|nr:hypothetical protein [Pseudomonas psychrophila]AVX93353.1 hypothetical protein PkP19E3_35265 [Pseudomonas koreensis]MBJ2259691.1 hypothetical protein [Pseudomonas psychrophila]
MRTKLFCLFVLALALTTAKDASSGDGGPTLTVHTKANGMVVDAFRHYAGQSQRDTTGLIPEATSLGPQMFKLRFKECGEVKFSDQESGNAGIASGRGTTSKCQITNWDIQWKVVHVRR